MHFLTAGAVPPPLSADVCGGMRDDLPSSLAPLHSAFHISEPSNAV